MKMKMKRLAFVGVVVLLCSLFLAALPATAIAAEEDDFVLDIYGNANEDDTIDMRDLTYVKLIFFGEKSETEFADAKYDGEINPLDFVQIKLVIVGKEEELTIVDNAGRIVTIKKPVERIVSSHPGITEALKIVDAWDRVVGRDCSTSDPILYSNLDELPVVSGPTGPYDLNYEEVFELHPDIVLVVAAPMPGFDDVVATLEPEIPVVALNFWEPETILENFQKLGFILGQEEEAEEFIEFYKRVEADISKVTSKIPEKDKPRLFYKGGGAVTGLIMTLTDTWPGIPYRYELTGSINIAADLPGISGWVEVDPEWLVVQDPDVVISYSQNQDILGLGVDDTSAAEAFRNEIMELDVFSGGTAVKNGDVYVTAWVFGTPKYIVGLTYRAKWLHPDLLQDLDPKAIHQEYLTKFMRIDYDLEKHGVFAYPEP
jgi:iron complex transport system substrate-binding protein